MEHKKDKSKYVSLAPKDEKRKEYEEYYNALDFAMKDKSIRNIAITGSYGAGKSSVIDSYFNNHKEIKCIRISLAYFGFNRAQNKVNSKNDEAENKGNGVIDNQKVLKTDEINATINKDLSENDIEAEVLKNLFYSIDGKKLKSNRFLTVKSKKGIKDYFFQGIFVFSIVAIVLLIKLVFDAIDNVFLNISDMKYTWGLMSRIPKLYIIVILVFCLTALIVFISSVVTNYDKLLPYIKSIIFKNTKIDMSDASTINNYLHEIMNFMIDVEESVFIFEDLDRYVNYNIFEKLRNLCILINNNEVIKQKFKYKNNVKCVKFIYAVKDDFVSLNNAKSLNCGNDLSEERTKFFDFIVPIIPMLTQNNISDAIDKIIKEYEIQGIDKRFISNVSLYINNIRTVNNIFNEFKTYKGSLFYANKYSDNRELLTLIIYKNINPRGFMELQGKDILHKVFKRIKEKVISKLEKYELELAKLNSEVLSDPSLESELDKEFINSFISDLNNNSEYIYTDKEISSVLDNDDTLDGFIIMSIKNKYIDENYYNYINYFYEGFIGLDDREYLKNVNQRKDANRFYEIENVENLYEYLDVEDFRYKSILNYYLLKYAVYNKPTDEKTYNLIKTIVKGYGLKEVNEVIKYFSADEQEENSNAIVQQFLNLCYKIDSEVFKSIDDEKVIFKGEQFDIVNRIILLMSPEQIKDIDKNKELTKVASTNIRLISELSEEKQNLYLDNIDFDCSLMKCDYDDKVGSLIEKIVKKKIETGEEVGYFDLLENYFKRKKGKEFNKNEFINNNYDYICGIGDEDLIGNIKDHIDSYVENCLLKTGSTKICFTNEILTLLYLLNNEKNAEKLVLKMEGKYDIAEFDYESDDEEHDNTKRKKCIYNSVIKNYNIDLTLESLYKYCIFCGWNDGVVEYVSKKIKYLQDNNNLDLQDETLDFYINLLLKCKNIDGVEKLIGNKKISFQLWQFDSLSDSIKSYLINNNNLDYNNALIQSIKTVDNKLLILYLTNNIDNYLKKQSDYDLSVVDIEEMIKLNKMNEEQIFQLINLKVTGRKVVERNSKIEKFIISSKKVFSQSIMEKAMNNLPFNDKVSMLLNKIDAIDNTSLIYLLRYDGGLFKEYEVKGIQNLYSVNIDTLKNNKTKKFLNKLIGKSIIKVKGLENGNTIFSL